MIDISRPRGTGFAFQKPLMPSDGNAGGETAVSHLVHVRRELVNYLHGLPDLIRFHGPDSIGPVTLQLGKCLEWIGYTLDQWQFGHFATDETSVRKLGSELRSLGLRLLDDPHTSDLEKTVATLKRQVELLEQILQLRKGGPQ